MFILALRFAHFLHPAFPFGPFAVSSESGDRAQATRRQYSNQLRPAQVSRSSLSGLTQGSHGRSDGRVPIGSSVPGGPTGCRPEPIHRPAMGGGTIIGSRRLTNPGGLYLQVRLPGCSSSRLNGKGPGLPGTLDYPIIVTPPFAPAKDGTP